jgi:hypothetical protein
MIMYEILEQVLDISHLPLDAPLLLASIGISADLRIHIERRLSGNVVDGAYM